MSFDAIKENYLMAKSLEKEELVSEHWDVFNKNFDKVIADKKIWKRMLRNALTLGFNDNLVEIGNKRFLQADDSLWKRLRHGKYDDLIFDIEDQDKKRIKLHEDRLMATIEFTDLKFVMQNTLSDIGTPVAAKFKTDGRFGVSEILCNLHDLDDIRHCWLILKSLASFSLPEKPLFCEIGAGYGGLSTKLRNNLPKVRFVIIDLPEVNAVQTYYLSKVFPDDTILGLRDFRLLGTKILKENFDFLILPASTIKELFKKQEVDVFINIRSMMEMNNITLNFYFDTIQSSLKERGIFVCFNRYVKKVGKFLNRFDEYPFDKNWKIISSNINVFQPNIHNLIAQRYYALESDTFIVDLKASLEKAQQSKIQSNGSVI